MIIMKNLRKIFCLKTAKVDERGFVLLELIIGLPLMLALLLAMSSIFINTLQRCKILVADFILQQEMQSAMVRIVNDVKMANKAERKNSNRLVLSHIGEEYASIKNIKPIVYFFEKTQQSDLRSIYRQRDIYAKSAPITGANDFSKTNVLRFEYYPQNGNSKILLLRLEAESKVSGHKFILTTKVHLQGASLNGQ